MGINSVGGLPPGLKRDELEGIVERVLIPETPVRVEYRLTEKGRDLGSAIDALSSWAERWAEPEAAPVTP